MQTEQLNGRANREFPGLLRVGKTLATGERVSYLYHRPTKRRLYCAYGTPEFALEYAEAVKRGARKKGRGGFVPVPGQVYFVRAEALGLVKIGKTGDLARRMNALRVASPDRLSVLAVVDDPTGMLERELHLRFAGDRLHGEWFKPSAAIMDYVSSLS